MRWLLCFSVVCILLFEINLWHYFMVLQPFLYLFFFFLTFVAVLHTFALTLYLVIHLVPFWLFAVVFFLFPLWSFCVSYFWFNRILPELCNFETRNVPYKGPGTGSLTLCLFSNSYMCIVENKNRPWLHLEIQAATVSRVLQLHEHDINFNQRHWLKTQASLRFLCCQFGSTQRLHVWWHQSMLWAAVQSARRQQSYQQLRHCELHNDQPDQMTTMCPSQSFSVGLQERCDCMKPGQTS